MRPTTSSDFTVKTRSYYDTLLAKDPTNNFRMKELAEVRAGLASVLNAKDGGGRIGRMGERVDRVADHLI